MIRAGGTFRILATKLIYLACVCMVVFGPAASTVSAMTPEQQKLFREGINYFDICNADGSSGSSSSSSSGGGTAAASGGSYNFTSPQQGWIDTDVNWGPMAGGGDASKTSFVALSSEEAAKTNPNMQPGDVIVLTYQNKIAYAIYGDSAASRSSSSPYPHGFGDGTQYLEVSPHTATTLTGTADNLPPGVHVTLYPGTAHLLGSSNAQQRDQTNIDRIGAQLSGGATTGTSSTTSSTNSCCSVSSSSSPAASSGSGSASTGSQGAFSIDQVKTFASEPVTSTWNISDRTVEQWFLKQAGAQATISKFGLNAGNIAQITAAVQAANVSPVFFYLYAVNEGGGAGGFVNHYGSDAPGGGPANATRDAQYLASQSKDKSAGPATGGGEPADMPTAEAKQILDALPSGSLGVVYIQATSAVTSELETLSGKTGDWSNNQFGKPLSDAMQNIKTMGGDPMQGGSTVSTGGGCTGTASGLTGAGMQKGIEFAKFIANNSGYGYDQATRTSGWAKYQSDPTCSTQCGSFDCSSLISAVVTVAGYFKTNPEFATMSEGPALTGAGFKNVTTSVNLATGANMQPGDILVNTADHTALYIGNNQIIAATSNENGGANGGQLGDQNGQEIMIQPYYNFPWNDVYRAPN